MAEAFADLETPLSLYLKLAHGRAAASTASCWNPWSAASASAATASSACRRARCCAPAASAPTPHRGGDRRPGGGSAGGNPLDFIAAYQKRFKVALRPACRAFAAAWRATSATTRCATSRRSWSTCPPDTLGTPDILLLQCEELAVIDNLSGKLYLIVYADPAQPRPMRAPEAPARAQGPARYSVSAPQVKPSESHPAERSFAKADYLAAVERPRS
jgi:anthranilate synthase component 1